jgi:hypothetical protein
MPQHQNSSKLQPTNCATTTSMPLTHIYMTHHLQDQQIVQQQNICSGIYFVVTQFVGLEGDGSCICVLVAYILLLHKAKIYAIIISENNIHRRHYVMFISWLCSCVSSPQWFERWSSSSMSNIHCWPIMHLSMTKL